MYELLTAAYLLTVFISLLFIYDIIFDKNER